MNRNGATKLIRITSSTSFTWPATFGKRHHSPPYSILYASLYGLHPNVTFPHDSQMRIPKLGLLLFQSSGCSYFFQIKLFLKIKGQYLIILKNIFPMVYITPQSTSFDFCFQGIYGQESNSQFDSRPFF